MKVGDYVRTDKGEIGKLKELKLDYTTGKRLVNSYTTRTVKENYVNYDNNNITERFVNGSCYYLTDEELEKVEKSIVKSSPNIIELIEVGDYVNGHIVDTIDENKELWCGDEEGIITYDNNDIKSIVTKEQFEIMEYRIGD